MSIMTSSSTNLSTVDSDEKPLPDLSIVFSPLYKHSNGLVHWSPDGKYLLVVKENRVTIRDPETLRLEHVFTSLDIIQHVEWSKDSKYILAAMYKRNTVQVFSLQDKTWTCKITEGIGGLVYATWAPDSRHILTVADFQMFITIWSLAEKGTSYTIRHPKLAKEGLAFHSEGTLLAVAERHDCKDFIGIYDCTSWELKSHFQVSTTDLVEITWSSTGRSLCLRDTHLEYNIAFYSDTGLLLHSYQAYQHALGIKSVSWSMCGGFIAVGSFDGKVRLLNNVTWTPIVTLSLDPSKLVVNQDLRGYQEYEHIDTDDMSLHFISAPAFQNTRGVKQYGVHQSQDIPKMKPLVIDPLSVKSRHGIGMISWSYDSKYMVMKNDQYPNTVWIWGVSNFRLHSVIVLLDPIKSVKWDPQNCQFSVCSNQGHVYIWTPSDLLSLKFPSDKMRTLGLRWHPNQNKLTLLGKEELCNCTFESRSHANDDE